MSMAVSDLLDVEAAAAHVGCSTHTIKYRMSKCGLTPSLKLGPTKFFVAEDLDAHFREKPLGVYHRRR